MFFALSKILYFLIQPIIWILFFSALAIFKKSEKWKQRSGKIAFLILIIFSNPWLVGKIEKKWSYAPQELNFLKEKYDVGIVLGGFSYPSALPESFYHSNLNADRITTAIELYKTGKIEKILITSGSGKLIGDQTNETNYAKSFLIRIGIPDSVIISESNSRNTFENATETKKIIDKLYINKNPKILLITSPFHMRRTIACFKKAGLTTILPFPAGTIESKDTITFTNSICPSIEAIMAWEKILKEIIGMGVYKLKGFI